MMKIVFEISFTFDTFKLFPKEKVYMFTNWMACKIDSIKTGKVDKNVGFSRT